MTCPTRLLDLEVCDEYTIKWIEAIDLLYWMLVFVLFQLQSVSIELFFTNLVHATTY